jgi:hypothetical protein
MKWGDEIPAQARPVVAALLGSVGEPINPEAWMWYHEVIGGGRCPIVDTWWQTETGAIMISPLPGVTADQARLGDAFPLPGIAPTSSTTTASRSPNGGGGYLVLTEPWPSMLRGIWGDDERYRETYWSRFRQGIYFAGDGAKRDDDGYFWLLGRVDDVMNVSGHRISTTEVESALVDHPAVAEAAVVGATDDDTGQAIVAFVILRSGAGRDRRRRATRWSRSCATTSPRRSARSPSRSRSSSSPELPKTRSGKIMRRLLRDVAEHRARRHHHAGRRAGGADELRREPHAGVVAGDPGGQERGRERRTRRGDAQVAGEGERQPGTCTRAVDRGDRDLREAVQQRRGLGVLAQARRLRLQRGRSHHRAETGGEVAARAEAAARTRQHQHVHGRVAAHLVQGGQQRCRQVGRDRVEPVRAVQRDSRDRTVDVDEHGSSGVDHRRLLVRVRPRRYRRRPPPL